MRRKTKLRKAKRLDVGWQIKDSLGDWITLTSRSESKDLYHHVVHLCFYDRYGRAHRFRPKQRVMSRRTY